MRRTLDLFTLTWTAVTLVFPCNAETFPPPTRLSYKWIDPFTVNVTWTWQKPHGLPSKCKILFEIQLEKTRRQLPNSFFTVRCLSEGLQSTQCTYNIRAISNESCGGWDGSISVPITIDKPATGDIGVKDFECLLDSAGVNCSWITADQSVSSVLSYSICGVSDEPVKDVKMCDQPYSSGMRNGCYMLYVHQNSQSRYLNLCILMNTTLGWTTFKPEFVISSPKLSITQEGDYLYLNWIPPNFQSSCTWRYKFCFEECSVPKGCENTIIEVGEPNVTRVPYNDRCLYRFNSSVSTTKYCPHLTSTLSEVVTYGTNKPPDATMVVTAIVIPLILSVCFILSCYCFRRHSAIFCPIIPDPSAIFKEMMMNGNKDLKTTAAGSLYTPVPEKFESCNITVVKENTVLLQNS
ncbi:interleukin-13 receptor subunit alpha-1-like [Mastacembelus armatus]|uniref:interleukin-13 receptor subunit alpha-1-like n=1 Tax=Mastacembelus armatus TaxID=205130 RepID=UPI000E45AD64|nr:interleukin-13 receptor subunit alpha-1-like [Mastacembelus armatus]